MSDKPVEEPHDIDSQPDVADNQEQESEQADAIAKLQADLDNFRDLALRSQADLDNFRKRASREREESIRFANAELIERLLPIIDSFALGLEAAADDESSGAAIIHDGLSMVFRQLTGLLEDFGVTEVAAEGEKFDPNLHEAVAQEPSDEVPDGAIIRVMRKGYLFRERLLRAANVVVSSGPDQS